NVVANKESNDVYVILSEGPGIFRDPEDQVLILKAGQSPVQVQFGKLDTSDSTKSKDLIVLNSGSDDITFFRGFSANLPSAGVSILTGGAGPSTAVVDDFNADGVDDLIVLN